jgi:hypothetical protein
MMLRDSCCFALEVRSAALSTRCRKSRAIILREHIALSFGAKRWPLPLFDRTIRRNHLVGLLKDLLEQDLHLSERIHWVVHVLDVREFAVAASLPLPVDFSFAAELADAPDHKANSVPLHEIVIQHVVHVAEHEAQ